MEVPALPQIEGKFLAVKFGLGKRDRAYIQEPSLEMQAGRLFLTGTPYYYDRDRPVQERVCIAWDAVSEYFIFESAKHLQDSWEPSSTVEKKTHWWRKS